MFKFEEGKDYYIEGGRLIMTENYLKKRGICCGSGCKNCPYEPQHQKGNEKIREKGGNLD